MNVDNRRIPEEKEEEKRKKRRRRRRDKMVARENVNLKEVENVVEVDCFINRPALQYD